jgi:GMP synthase-like glutamine amidotransferase
MNLHVLQHHGCEGPGEIAAWAEARGATVATTHLYRGEPLPAPSDVDLLVVMGGPMNIYQDRNHPWLRGERAFIAAHIASGKPAVGVCLGSQFLADALGGRVIQNPKIEIGWLPVKFSREARTNLPFLPEAQEVMHWHGDTFELPEGAVRLATSEGCVNQGFLYENRVLALQFHPEMTRDGISGLVREFGDELEPGEFVQTAEEILAAKDETFSSAHALLHQLLDAIVPAP